MRPFLRWAGSKRKLLPELEPFCVSAPGKYIEPFMGSACLFFSVEPKKAILGDTNGALVETFKTVRDNPTAVHKCLRSLRRDHNTYYTVRAEKLDVLGVARRAARFVYLNRLCFNGIYRTNSAGVFNVPYGGDRSGKFPSLRALRDASDVLQNVAIFHQDFEETLAAAEFGDFVYLDPPYSVENRRVFKQYGAAVFGISDLERLARQLKLINTRGVFFVLSYAMCEEALKLFKRWTIKKRIAVRNVSGFAKHRRRAVELLVTNIV